MLLHLRQLRGAALQEADAVTPAVEEDGLGEIELFWGEGAPAAVPAAPLVASRPDALLDQLDPPPLALGGQSIVELLRPAYQALRESGG